MTQQVTGVGTKVTTDPYTAGEFNDVNGAVNLNAADAESRMAANATAIKPTQNYLSTGLLSGGLLSVNTDPTKFDVAAGTGIIVDNSDPLLPVVTQISWSAFTAEAVPDVVNDGFTSVAVAADGLSIITDGGVLKSHAQELATIVLGSAVHRATTITSFAFKPNIITNVHHQFKDLLDAIGPINLNDGAVMSSNGANMKLDKSAGRTFTAFGNAINDMLDVHHVDHGSAVGFPFSRSFRDGAGGFTGIGVVTDVDSTQYDDGSGSLVALPGGSNIWVVHAMWYFAASDNYVMEFGQTTYTSLAEAVADIPVSAFIHNPLLPGGGSLRAWIAVKKNATDLSNTGDNAVVRAPRFNP